MGMKLKHLHSTWPILVFIHEKWYLEDSKLSLINEWRNTMRHARNKDVVRHRALMAVMK